jgi:hypothetical protein
MRDKHDLEHKLDGIDKDLNLLKVHYMLHSFVQEFFKELLVRYDFTYFKQPQEDVLRVDCVPGQNRDKVEKELS